MSNLRHRDAPTAVRGAMPTPPTAPRNRVGHVSGGVGLPHAGGSAGKTPVPRLEPVLIGVGQAFQPVTDRLESRSHIAYRDRLLSTAGGDAFVRMPGVVAVVLLSTLASQGRMQGWPTASPMADAASPGQRRVIHRFDFDEQAAGNFERLPMHWRRVDAEVFPGFARGEFDLNVGRTGPPAFHLRADGRNVAYWYQGPDTPVQFRSEHLIIGFLRPDRLVNARAALSAYYLDRQRLPMAGTQVFSRLIGGPGDEAQWHEVEIGLAAAPPGAQTVGITAWVVQADVWDPRTRPHRHIEQIDVHGGAWFDDIAVYRMPSASLTTAAPGDVFVAPDDPVLLVTVADADAADMQASLEVRSIEGELVYDTNVAVQPTESAQVSPVRLWGLRPGLYEATLVIKAGDTATQTRSVRFARLAAVQNPGAGVARHFGIALDPGVPLEPRAAQTLLSALRVGAVKIPVWGRSVLADPGSGAASATDELLHELVRSQVQLTGVLSAPPAELVESAGSLARSLLEILSDDPAGWRGQLAAVVAPYASVFRAWQVGADGDRTVIGDAKYPAALANVRDEMVPLITAVDLTVPGDAGRAAAGQTPPAEEITLLVDRDVHDNWIAAYLSDFRDLDYLRVSAYLAAGGGTEYARQPALADFARRVIRARHSDVATIYTPQLWHSRSTSAGITVEPTEAFIAYRTIIDLLSDLTPGPPLNLAPDVEALAFDDVDESVVVLWAPTAPPEGRTHQLQLGSAERQIDLWGRVTRLPPLEDGRREVRVYPQPTFIPGVERWLVDFTATIALDPTEVEISVLPQVHHLRLTNSGTHPRSGRVELVTPEAWEVRPREFAFHLPPASTTEQAIEIRYGHNEAAGPKLMRALIEFASEPRLQLEIPLEIKLGLKDVDVWGFALLEGGRLVLRHGITNRSNETMSFRSQASAPGRSRQFRVIANLAPGATSTEEYRFDRADALTGRTVRLSLRQVDGPRTHSIELAVP